VKPITITIRRLACFKVLKIKCFTSFDLHKTGDYCAIRFRISSSLRNSSP
jgi:hypothetical protein